MGKSINIPGYKIKKELGVGGMARVYLANDLKFGRQVAVKVLSPVIAQDNPRLTKRFIREAKTAARLHHSNIVSIYDVGKTDGVNYFTMEYLQESLKDRLKNGKLKPLEAFEIIKEIAKALDYAHKKGFVHRDIKPDNIMFRKDGAVVLLDFGIVKSLHDTTKLTRTGMAVGTPQYMSPEQVEARKIDGRSDIYSLGIVLFELLTGRVPYRADSAISVALMHTEEPVPELPNRLKQFQPLIDKMLSKNRKSRVKDAEGLIRLLDAMVYKVKQETANVKRPVIIEKTKSSKLPLAAALVAAVILAVGAGYFFIEAKKNQEQTAWKMAKASHSLSGYQAYITEYPEGIHSDDARRAIDLIAKENKYKELFEQAADFYRQGDYDNAAKKLVQARKIKNTPETDGLEKQIKKKKKELKELKFNDYLLQARSYFEMGEIDTASEILQRAKKIKTTPQLLVLEKQIEEAKAAVREDDGKSDGLP